jgi:hypothetical protein
MPTTAQFEEKEYELPLFSELAARSPIWSPGQVAESVIGIEHQQKILARLARKLGNRALVSYACPAFHETATLHNHTGARALVANSTKEFRAPDGTLLETRLIEHVADTGSDDVDFWTGAFVWRADGGDAVLTPEGATHVNGTSYDVPAQAMCRSCHAGKPGYALGLSHVQLSGPGRGMRLADFTAAGLLTDPPASEFVTPGDPVTAGALGYLHANCGHCHNPLGAASYVGMTLRLSAADLAPEATGTWLTTVAVPTYWSLPSTNNCWVRRKDGKC